MQLVLYGAQHVRMQKVNPCVQSTCILSFLVRSACDINVLKFRARHVLLEYQNLVFYWSCSIKNLIVLLQYLYNNMVS